MARVVSRSEIADVLRQWQARALTVGQVYEWAERLYLPGEIDFDDNEGEEEESAAKEVLASLELLKMNLVTADDIPIYLEFLNTPSGQFKEGYQRFLTALSDIDHKKRSLALADDPFYAAYCK